MTRDSEFARVWRNADAAGRRAADATTPRAMVVTQHANPIDDASPVVKSWYVPSGVCGFAYIRSKGNTPFGRWMKRVKGATKWYPTGVAVSVHDYGQSYEKKAAYAYAFVRELRHAGIDGVWSEDRLD